MCWHPLTVPRSRCLALLLELLVALAQPWGWALQRRERCVPGPFAGMLDVPQPGPWGPLEAPRDGQPSAV